MVEAIQRGQTAAEAALYEKYAARVYYLALSELRAPADAEDVRAETFLRVIPAIRAGRLRSPEALASFILGTAANVIRELARKGRRAEPVSDQELEQLRRAESPPPDADTRRAIEQVIGRLKPREQAFLRMYYYEERSKEEISERLGIKEDRMRLIKSRALKSFREIYERLMKKS